jgi:hypothetical protein
MMCSTGFNYVILEGLNQLYKTHDVCKCFPACESINYKYEIIYSRYDGWKNESLWYETEFIFKFRDSEYFPLVRSQQFKFKDFICYVGGLLGLFAGISVLSIYETFYFFSIRLLSNAFRLVSFKPRY